MKTLRLAIFASGNGSNAVSILKNLPIGLKVEFVLSDNLDAPVLKKVKVPTYAVPLKTTRSQQEGEILNLLQKHHVDWVCLAGYMRILSRDFLRKFSQVVNIHPSLLPHYPGINSIERAFNDQVQESGVTLHLVDEGIDTGKIIFQEKVQRSPSDTLEDFKLKIHACEHEIYKRFLNHLGSSNAQNSH